MDTWSRKEEYSLRIQVHGKVSNELLLTHIHLKNWTAASSLTPVILENKPTRSPVGLSQRWEQDSLLYGGVPLTLWNSKATEGSPNVGKLEIKV